MNKDIAFYDLSKIAEDKSKLSEMQEEGKWEAVTYETAYFSGKMLCAGECVYPEDITLKLNVCGWYRVFFGFMGVSYNTRTAITLGKYGKNVFDLPPVNTWDAQGQIAEEFWCAADLTGIDITLSKPEGISPVSAGLAYIRLEKMTEEQVKTYLLTSGGCVNYHLDEDYFGEAKYHSAEDYLGRINAFGGSGGGIIFHETGSEGTVFGEGESGLPYTELIRRRNFYSENFQKNKLKIKSLIIERAREMGYEVYATKRIQVGDFHIPLTRQFLDSYALAGNEEYRIKTRGGRFLTALSFAYEKVRKMAINSILESMDGCDFAGVSLAFHRGVFIGFETPVEEKVRELYGVEARRLPASDQRLHKVWGDFLTLFLYELKAKLDGCFGRNAKKINAIVFTDPVSSMNFGLDVERWAKEGLIDSVSQGLMAWREDLSGCLDEFGLIDAEKFKAECGEREVLQRFYDGNDFASIVGGAKEFMKILSPYGAEFFATLGWESATVENTYRLARELRAAGVKKLFSWNANHKARRPYLLNAEKDISVNFEKGCFVEKPTIKKYRVLSVGGKDLTEYNVNWNG